MRSRHVRAYRALLHLYPRRFRAEYTEEMCRVFAQQLHYARVTEGWPGVLRVWALSLVDLVITAPSQHVEDDVFVASPAGASGWQATLGARPPARRWALIGLGPVWALLAYLVLLRNWGEAIFLNPPEVLGLPAGVVLVGLALVWGLLGLEAVANPRPSSLRPALTIFFGIFILISIAAAFYGFLKLPPLFRLLAGIAPAGLAVVWWANGRPRLSHARPSTVRLAVLLFFTVPATALVLVTPAVVLVVLNLTT